MASLYCSRCSTMVEEEGGLCPRCGTRFDSTVTDHDTRASPGDPSGPLLFPPGHVFAGRFTIVERVGAGGMGVVYKAIDTILKEEVALKLIQPSLTQIPTFAERFRREVRLTRQITHPNVCRVHDIGEAEAILYLSMEWIEGQTLQQLLQQTRRLKESRALEIAQKIALALGAAHERGIIHRDLKPGNVMIDRHGNVHVLDFGLAVEQGRGDITQVGVVVGSPYYMAPEQRKLREIDHRADFYALGLTLREMLLGDRLDPIPALPPGVRSAVSPCILPVLERLLAEDPEERYASASEVSQAIADLLDNPDLSTVTPAWISVPPARARRPGVLIWAGAAVLVFAAAVWVYWPDHPTPGIDRRAAGYYDRGLHYTREAQTVRDVDTAIEMFNRALEIDSGSALAWAALGEANWLRYGLTPPEEEEARKARRNEAHRAVDRASQIDGSLPEVLYVRGISFMSEGDCPAARADLEKAVKAKPDFAMAWANLGSVYEALDDYAAALAANRKALDLEPRSYIMQIYLGLFHQKFSEYDAASKYYRAATELKPDSAIAWNNLGAILLFTQRYAEAIQVFERALKIENRASARSNLGTAYYYQERYEDAVKQYRMATELEPKSAVHWGNLGDALLVLGKLEDARASYTRAATVARETVASAPRSPKARMDLALYCAKARDEQCALKAGEAATAMQPRDATTLFVNAVVLCQFGRDEECLNWLEKAVKLGLTKAQIEGAPEFDRLRAHPRFRAIVALAS